MRKLKSHSMLLGAIGVGVIAVLCAGFQIHAQESRLEQLPELEPAEIKTLDDVRKLTESNPSPDLFVTSPSIPIPGTNPFGVDSHAATQSKQDPRTLAMQRIRELQERLALPDADHTEIEGLLKTALNEYFLADMKHRVRELDDIKAKLTKTEAKLQKRLDEQQETVDLQLKVMLRESAGLGFFNPEDGAPNISIRPIPGRPGAYMRVEKTPMGIEKITVVDPEAKTSRGPIPRPKPPTPAKLD